MRIGEKMNSEKNDRDSFPHAAFIVCCYRRHHYTNPYNKKYTAPTTVLTIINPLYDAPKYNRLLKILNRGS